MLPPDHPFFVYALSTEVVAYAKLKELRQAENIIPEMLKLGESRLGVNHRQRVTLLNNAAAVYNIEKKYSQAEPLVREAVAVSKNDFPPGHPLVRSTLLEYSYVLEKLNRKPEAARYRTEAQVLLAFPRWRTRHGTSFANSRASVAPNDYRRLDSGNSSDSKYFRINSSLSASEVPLPAIEIVRSFAVSRRSGQCTTSRFHDPSSDRGPSGISRTIGVCEDLFCILVQGRS
jgi:hypothetical protein